VLSVDYENLNNGRFYELNTTYKWNIRIVNNDFVGKLMTTEFFEILYKFDL